VTLEFVPSLPEGLHAIRRRECRGAVDVLAALLQDVQALFGGLEMLVAQQLLDAPQALAVLQQMRGKSTM
jgi:hypothetical protein